MASRPKTELTREALAPLVYEGLTLAEIGARVGRPAQTVRRAVERAGLPQPIEVRRQLVEDALRSGTGTLIRECRYHGTTQFAIVGSERRLRCKACRAEAVARRRRKVKRILVQEAGGQCELCGYDRCMQALEFHHRDPHTKEFGIAMRGITRSISAVRREVAKCALLCANCHAEVEAGIAEVPLQS